MRSKKVLKCLWGIFLLISCFTLTSCVINNTKVTKYVVTYNSGELTNVGENVQKEYEANAVVTIISNPYTSNDYTFNGWKSGNQIYQPGDTFTMPTTNVKLEAIWLKNIMVSFETFGGSVINPISLKSGDMLMDMDIEVPSKNDMVFLHWYLDSDLTNRYIAGEYSFNKDTTLYASYTNITEGDYHQYLEEETTLVSQEDMVSFTLVSNKQINNNNINDYVKLSRLNEDDESILPNLIVLPLENNRYLLDPSSKYTAGQDYVIETIKDCYLEVTMEDDSEIQKLKNYSRVNFGIKASTTNVKEYQKDIIWLKQGEYIEYVKENILIIKSEVFIAKEINTNAIISVISEDGEDEDLELDEEFYKAGNFTKLTLDGKTASFIEIELLECELTDVYLSLDYYEETALELDKYVDAIDRQNIINNVRDNQDLKYFMRLAAASAADYTNKANISLVNAIEEKDTDIDFSIEKHSKMAFTATIDVSGTYKLAKNVYAEITVTTSQYIFIGLQAKGKVELTKWNFDVKALLTSNTDVKFDVVLIKDDVRINIKNKIQQGIDEYEPNSFVSQYKEIVGMRTDELTIVRINLFRPSIVLGNIFELGFPVDFVVSVDVNGAFSADIYCSVKKNFGMRGNSGGSNKGVKSYTENVSTKYEYDFYYYGKTTLKAGISFGMELSFNNLSSLGRAGLEVEVGTYFEFSGYGSYYVNYPVKIENYNSDVIKKAAGGYYYEFGIYLELNLYFRSDIFEYSADYTAVEKRYKLFDGGNETMAVKFSDSNEKSVQTSSTELNIDKLNVFSIDFMKLSDGSIKSKEVNDKLLFFIKGTGLYLDENNNIKVYDKYKDIRLEGEVLIRYYGLHANLSGSYLDYSFKYSYIPKSLNISKEDINKTFTVKFMVEDILIDTKTVRIGEATTMPTLGDSWKKEHPEYLSVGFDHRILEPIMEDTVYQAWFRKREGAVMFTYLLIDETLAKGEEVWNTETIYATWGETCNDLLKRLSNPVGDVDEKYYKFIGWPEFSEIAFEDDKGTLTIVGYRAIYEKVDVSVDVHIEAFVNEFGKTLIPESNFTVKVPFMGKATEFLRAKLYPGFEREYHYDSPDGELITIDENFVTPRFYDNRKVYGKYTQTMQFTVRILRSDGQVIYERNDVSYGEDVREMLKNQAVLDYIASGPVPANIDPSLPFEYEFSNWWYPSVDDLDFIFEDTDVKPCFDYILTTYKVFLDGNGGNIPEYMKYNAINGWEYGKNTTITNDLFASSAPKKAADENNNYVFDGWGYKDENNNLIPLQGNEITLTGNITLYALWKESSRTFIVNLKASNGMYYSIDTGKSLNISCNIPNYEDKTNLTQLQWTNLSKNEKDLLLEKLTSTNGSIPLPLTEADQEKYQFSHWQISEFIEDDLIELEPVFILADGSVNIICHLQGGELDGIKDTFVENIVVESGVTTIISIGNYISPTSFEEYTYNPSGDLEEQSYHFKDANYYYLFDGWLFGEETEVMEKNRTITLNADSPDITLTATYKAVPQTKSIKFAIETLYPYNEIFADGDSNWSKIFYGYYGSMFSETLIPSVLKTDYVEFSLYEYQFKNWFCEETNMSGVSQVFDDDYIYKPVFEKKLQDLTIILDASEMGVFPSTGERYRKIETFAGVTLNDFGEEPIYNIYTQNVSTYYDYEFMYWDYNLPYTFTTTEDEVIVTALFKPIRNKTAAPDTGMIISKDGVSEDIGQNTIKGYEYNPEEKILYVNEPGFTIDGQGKTFDINVWILTSEVTFKNITLTSTDNPLLYVAYYPQTQTNEEVTINISGEVKLHGNYTYDGGNGVIFGGVNTTINGITTDSNLEITANYSETVTQFARAVTSHQLKFKNLTVDMNLTVQTNTVDLYGFYITYGKEEGSLTLDNSTINLTVKGSSINKAYAIYASPDFILDEEIKNKINLTNCELLKQE